MSCPVSPAVLALRGATTLDADEKTHLVERVQTLLREMLERNDVAHDDIVSIIFTATDDVHCCFPAVAAREMGLGDVPLLCARELDIDGGMPMCIRVLMHIATARTRDQLRHVYLGAARSLRDDLPE